MGSKGVRGRHAVTWLPRGGPPVVGQTSQEADSEMKISVKDIYWEMLFGSPPSGEEKKAGRSRGWAGLQCSPKGLSWSISYRGRAPRGVSG